MTIAGFGRVPPLSTEPVTTARLLLPLFSDDDVRAMLDGRRLPGWDAGYPREDDVDIARHLAGSPAPGEAERRWSPRHIVRRDTGRAVGSIGFFGAPGGDRTVEIGYGLVETSWGRGLASEAVAALVASAEETGEVDLVIAHTLADNEPSQRVLLKNGFHGAGVNDDGERRFERRTPNG